MKNNYTNRYGWKGWGIAITMLAFLTLPLSRVEAVPPAGFVDASTFGFATDPYIALQAAINTGRDVYVPLMASNWVLSQPIFLHTDGQEVLFESGVIVESDGVGFMGEDNTFDGLFQIVDRNGVTLRGPGATFRMPATTSFDGRHGGIRVRNSKNVNILGLTIEDIDGDGIILEARANGLVSENVTIQDVTINRVVRNGISVIGVDGLLIDNTTIVNTFGAPLGPEAGIDFEPDFPLATRIVDVVIRDTIIADNGGFAPVPLGGVGIIWSVPNISGGVQTTGLVENVTVFGNVSHGLSFNDGTLPGWEVRDSLIGENGGPTTTGFSSFGGGPDFFVTNTAFWGQTNPVSGDVMLGAGTETGVTPIFLSTTFGDPNYLVLDLNNNPTSILTGASDGGYLGARAPAAALEAATEAIPEPTSAVLFGLAAMSMLVMVRKRHLARGMMTLALLFVLVGSSTPAYATSHGELLAYWNFDELDDTAPALDPIGERNAVLMGNATRVDDGPAGYGRALSLDGTTGTFADVGVEAALSLLGFNYTVAFWVRPTAPIATPAIPQDLVGMDDGLDRSGGYRFFYSGTPGKLTALHHNGVLPGGGNNSQTFNAGGIPQDIWTHYAITYDFFAPTGEERKVYRRGVLISSGDGTGHPGVPGPDEEVILGGSLLMDNDDLDPLQFGGGPSGYGVNGDGNNFVGDLDDIRLYNYTLTQVEALALFEANAPPVFAASDFNDNGFVNGGDLALWETGFGQFSTSVAKIDGDANRDQRVNGGDFLRWQRQFTGAGSPLSAAVAGAVPEPSTSLLLLMGLGFGSLLPRRRKLRG